MARIKFLTFFDCDADNDNIIEAATNRHISFIPTVFRTGDCLFVDILKPNIKRFDKFRHLTPIECEALDDEKYLLRLFKEISLSGYDSLFVMCPDSKLTPHHKTVCNAVQRFKRNKYYSEINDMNITVIDTEQFGAGLLMQTFMICDAVLNYNYGIEELKAMCRKTAVNSKLYALTRDDENFFNGKLRAYKVCGGSFEPLNISESIDEVKYDRFTEIIGNELKTGKYSGYAVSVGENCDFSMNIIGRLKMITQCGPALTRKYSLISSSVFGINTVLVHLYNDENRQML